MTATGETYTFRCDQPDCEAEFAGSTSELEAAGWYNECMSSPYEEDNAHYCPEHREGRG